MIPPRTLVPGLVLAAGLLGACATPPRVHPGMTDVEIRASLDAAIPRGTPADDVDRRLDELAVSRRYRTRYDATADRPEVLLVRLFPVGGFWVDPNHNDVIRWVDASFVFDAERLLDRTLLFRDAVRYFHGDPVGTTDRPGAGPLRSFPLPPPPPADPLEGAT